MNYSLVNCLSVFVHFVGLVIKGLNSTSTILITIKCPPLCHKKSTRSNNTQITNAKLSRIENVTYRGVYRQSFFFWNPHLKTLYKKPAEATLTLRARQHVPKSISVLDMF